MANVYIDKWQSLTTSMYYHYVNSIYINISLPGRHMTTTLKTSTVDGWDVTEAETHEKTLRPKSKSDFLGVGWGFSTLNSAVVVVVDPHPPAPVALCYSVSVVVHNQSVYPLAAVRI